MVAALRAYSMPGKRPGCGGRSIPLGLTPTEPCTRQRESPDAQVVLDPAFAGLPFSAWCKKLKDDSPQAQPRGQVIKFSFEYTPRLTDTVGVSIWN